MNNWTRNLAVLCWAAARYPDEFTRYRKRTLVEFVYNMWTKYE